MRNAKKIHVYFITVILLLLFNFTCVYADGLQGEILIIHSYNSSDEWTKSIQSGIESAFREDDIYYEIEYMDTKREYNEDYIKKLKELYKGKYEKKRFNVIFVSDNAAFEFMLENKDEIFPYTPIVFCGVNDFDFSQIEDEKYITGIEQVEDIKSNIELICTIHPDTKNIIAVMDDTDLGDEYDKDLQKIIDKEDFNIPIIKIKGEKLEKIIKEINSYPKDSVILFMASRIIKNNGHVLTPSKAVQVVNESTNNPIYGIWDILLEHGIIGGNLSSGFYQGQSAGYIGKKIMIGNLPENIPIETQLHKKYSFNYDYLKKYNINISKLPKNSIIINEPESVYSIAKRTMQQAAVILMLIFASIMIYLILNINRRRKIEADLKESKATLQKNVMFLRVLLDTIPNPIYYKDINGKYLDINDAFAEFTGMKKDDIINKTVFQINQGEASNLYFEKDKSLIEKGGKQIYETEVKYADGSIRDILFSKALLTTEKKDIVGIVGVMHDITEHRKAENKINRLLKLKEAMLEVNHFLLETDNIKELFDLILDKAIQSIDVAELGCILVLNEKNELEASVFRKYNPEKMKDFKIPLEESLFWHKSNGKLEKSVIINDIDSFMNDDIVDIVDIIGKTGTRSTIMAPIIIDGKFYGEINVDSTTINAFKQEDLEIMEYLRNQVAIAISKHNLYEEKIYLAKYDKLTNIYNRRYFEELFDQCYNKALRYEERFCLSIFDLNGLKKVNDTYGHLAGDKYIKTFVEGMTSKIRSSDIFARFGGDEFIAIFFESDFDNLASKFEGLIDEFKNNPIIIEDNKIVCSFSYGTAHFPSEADSYGELVKLADERMYKYKQKFKRKELT